MKHYLQLIRWPNLLMIAIFQYALRYLLVFPILDYQEKGLIISHIDFFFLVLSTVCIAAGGYAVNDIEDVAIDTINKPTRVIGTKIKEDTANNFYTAITFVGVAFGFYLSFVKDIRLVGFIQIFSAGFLYFYATTYKCIPLLGNLIIGLLTGMTALLVIIAEPAAMEDPAVLMFTGSYMVFAFSMTVLRELIKDLEDQKGDSTCGCKTLPVMIGSIPVKIIAGLLSSLIVTTLIWIQISTKQWQAMLSFTYVTALVTVPLLILSILIFRAKEIKDFARCAVLSKMIMFTGIISIAIFYFSSKQ
jgi:4-hydroxybenzoate polyprenyltransferase